MQFLTYIKTIADSEEEREARAEAEREFDRLLTWLERTYTRVFATLRRCSSPSLSSSLRRVRQR
jgi:hypothetical protein